MFHHHDIIQNDLNPLSDKIIHQRRAPCCGIVGNLEKASI